MSSKTKIILKLNRVPPSFLADVLAFKGISRLDLVHKKNANFYEETDKFVKKYLPPLKYTNPSFDFRHTLDPEISVPRLLVYDREQKLRDTLETGSLSEAQIVEALKALDSKYTSGAQL